jgi:hypothetical protein
MSILDKAKDLLKKGADSLKEYEAKAPERRKNELERLKYENQRLGLQSKNQSLKDKVREQRNKRYNSFGSGSTMSIGMQKPTIGIPQKNKLNVPKPKKKKYNKQVIINL